MEPILDEDFLEEQVGNEKERVGRVLNKQEKENFITWLKYKSFRETKLMPYADWECFNSEFVPMVNKTIGSFETKLENARRFGKNGLIGHPDESNLL